MQTDRKSTLTRATRHYYRRLKNLSSSKDYSQSRSLTQQIQAITRQSYSQAANGDMRDFFTLLKNADIVDMEYSINGCAIWLPHGVKYKKQFVSLMSEELLDYNYEEYLFPNLISADDFAVLCDEIYDFDSQALKVSAHTIDAVLKPTGESAIYPSVARWIKEGKELPLRIFQSGPYFRYKSSPNAYLRPIECSFMLEAHGIFASKEEMNEEFDRALDMNAHWMRQLCLDPYVVSRPIAYNKPVSTKTIGFDVLLPNGKTIQAGMAYLQSQIFSGPYGVSFRENGTKKNTEQLTFGITERSIYTSLFAHVDDLGLRLSSAMAPEQVAIICRDQSELSQSVAIKLRQQLRKAGVRTQITPINSKENPFDLPVINGTPLQLVIDETLAHEGAIELFDRRSFDIKTLKLSTKLNASIKAALKTGDEVLLREQSQRKIAATQILGPDDIKQHQLASAGQKKCFQVVTHEDNKCINQIQTLGLGEYIGTDQSSGPLKGALCFACGRECETFGYLTKRL